MWDELLSNNNNKIRLRGKPKKSYSLLHVITVELYNERVWLYNDEEQPEQHNRYEWKKTAKKDGEYRRCQNGDGRYAQLHHTTDRVASYLHMVS